MNRFGFSERKSEVPTQRSVLSSNNGNNANIRFQSMTERKHKPMKTSSGSSLNNYPTNVYSTLKKPQNASNFSNPQSTSNDLFSSVRKTFQTPKQSGHKFAMPTSLSSAKLSRRSTMGKENRNISDPGFLKSAQERIINFLGENHFEMDRNQILRPSISSVSRIFEFLFALCGKEFTIKSNTDTALEVLIPKWMPLFGYPQTLKKSDFVSFAGGRQLGVIYHVIVYLINFIQCAHINDELKPKQCFDDEDERVQLKNEEVLRLQFNEENFNEETITQKCAEFAELVNGTPEQVEELKSEVEDIREQVRKLKEEVQSIVQMPVKNAELRKQIESLEYSNRQLDVDYELTESEYTSLNRRVETLLKELEIVEINEREVVARSKTQDSKTVREYRAARMLIQEVLTPQIQNLQKQMDLVNDQIPVSQTEIIKQKQTNSTMVAAIHDGLNYFIDRIPNQDFLKKIETHRKRCLELFDYFKNLEFQDVNDELMSTLNTSRSDLVDSLQAILREYRTFTVRLNDISNELIHKRDQLRVDLESKQNDLQLVQTQAKGCYSEHETLKNIEEDNLKTLDNKIQQLKKTHLDMDKEIETHRLEAEKARVRFVTLKSSFDAQMKKQVNEMFDEQKQIAQRYRECLEKQKKNNFKLEKLVQKRKEICERLKPKE